MAVNTLYKTHKYIQESVEVRDGEPIERLVVIFNDLLDRIPADAVQSKAVINYDHDYYSDYVEVKAVVTYWRPLTAEEIAEAEAAKKAQAKLQRQRKKNTEQQEYEQFLKLQKKYGTKI